MWFLVHLPCFPCVCPLFQCLLLFAILAAPSIFPFQFVPLLQCVFHTFPCVCLLSSSIRLSCPVPPPFYSLCPFLLSLLCVRLLTHALYFPCVPFVPVLLPLCRPFCPSFSVLGLSVPLVRVFSLVAPTFPVPFPLFPAAFPSSSSFVPAFSFPFSPLFSSPSFSIKKKVFP